MLHDFRSCMLLTCLFLAAAVTGCSDGSQQRKPDVPVPPTAEQVAEIEKVMKLKFPKSANFIGFDKFTQGSELLYSVKLELPAGDVAALLNSSLYRGKKLSSEVRFATSSAATKTWFDPENAQKFRSETAVIKPGIEEQRILIDDTRDGTATVYLSHSAAAS